MPHDPGAVGIAGVVMAGETIRFLLRKGLMTNEEGHQIWRDAVAIFDGNTNSQKDAIIAVLKEAAPPGTF